MAIIYTSVWYTVQGSPRVEVSKIRQTPSQPDVTISITGDRSFYNPGDIIIIDEPTYDAMIAQNEADAIQDQTDSDILREADRAQRSVDVGLLKAEFVGLGITPALLDSVLGS